MVKDHVVILHTELGWGNENLFVYLQPLIQVLLGFGGTVCPPLSLLSSAHSLEIKLWELTEALELSQMPDRSLIKSLQISESSYV